MNTAGMSIGTVPSRMSDKGVERDPVCGMNVNPAGAAAHLGIPEGLMVQLIEDIDKAPIDEKMKPILRYARKLTLSPSRMTQADANAVFAAGWNDQALHDAASTCALFNFMNRLVDGLRVKAGSDYFSLSAKRLRE